MTAETFFAAVEKGDLPAAQELLAKVGIDARKAPILVMNDKETWNAATKLGTNGPTALMLAMRRGDNAMAEWLLGKGADLGLIDQFGKTAMMQALEYGHCEMPIFKIIFDKGLLTAEVASKKDMFGVSLAAYAALNGAPEFVAPITNSSPRKGGGPSDSTRAGIEEKIEQLLSLSAKHGQAMVIERILESHRSDVGVKSGALVAVRVACRSGHWIPSLVDEVKDRLDELDADGMTPLMEALFNSQDDVARNLLDMGVLAATDAPMRNADGKGYDTAAQKRPVLLAALENNAELSTIRKLVLSGAPVKIPTVSDDIYSLAELKKIFAGPWNDAHKVHPIGKAIENARAERDSEVVEEYYAIVRAMFGAAFKEQPGSALCALVTLATTMRDHAERMHLENLDLSAYLKGEADEVGKSVGVLVNLLPAEERERLFRSTAGRNFLLSASESKCVKMLHSPAVTHHVDNLWTGELLTAILNGKGVCQWGGIAEIGTGKRLLLALFTLLVVLPANLLALPLVALCPPLLGGIKAALGALGTDGVDPRVWPYRPEGERGFSPTMQLWWRSLVLIDVPLFKFYGPQIGSAGLLVMMLWLAKCFEFDNTEQCFVERTREHMIGLGGDDLDQVFAIPDAEWKSTELGASSGLPTSEVIPVVWPGLDKDATFLMMIVYTISVFIPASQAGSSIATGSTAATAIAAVVSCAYLVLDLYAFADFDHRTTLQPLLLTLGAFMISLDVERRRSLTQRAPACIPCAVQTTHSAGRRLCPC